MGSTRIASPPGTAEQNASSEAELLDRLAEVEAELAEAKQSVARMAAAGQAAAEYYVVELTQAKSSDAVGESIIRMVKGYLDGRVDQNVPISAGVYFGPNPFNVSEGSVLGDLPRETLEHAWHTHPGTFKLLPIAQSDGPDLIAMAIPNPHRMEQAIAMLAVEAGSVDFETIEYVEAVIQAIALASMLHLDRIARTDQARFAADVARATARVQVRLVNPIELCSALAVALEELNGSDSIAGAAAVNLTTDTPELKGAFGEIDLETVMRVRQDSKAGENERVKVIPIVIDGEEEGLLAVRLADGAQAAEDEMLSSIGAAVVGSASRFRAASTIDLLRRTTTRQLVEAQERDRAIVAADIHDGTLQQLGATAMRLELIRARAAAGDTEAMDDLIDRCAADIRSSTRELRNLLMELRPQVLDDNGLAAALAELGRSVEGTAVSVTFDVPGQVNDDLAITIFRIVQEGLNNVRKHAHAKHAWVDVSQTPDAIRLEIRDDGVGFEGAASGPSSSGQHFGLLGMRERARMMGGEFSIVGHSGGGTIVTAVLPVSDKRNQAPMIAA